MSELPYKLFSGENVIFQLNDPDDSINEIVNFIEATPDNTYFYDQFEITRKMRSQDQGVLLLGIAPQNSCRPKRGVTLIWDHNRVPY